MTIVDKIERGDTAAELAAMIALLRTRGASAKQLAAVAHHEGTVTSLVDDLYDATLFEDGDAPEGRLTAGVLEQARADVAAWFRAGLRAVTVLDPDYPDNLHTIFDRPPFLFIKGQYLDTDSRSVAVVGTRAASAEGRARARRVTRAVVQAGYTVVSGLADGIDAEAHQSALDSGGRTVAVMGTGINRIYPTQNRDLADRIVASGGALVSQFLPDQPPTRWTFPERNIVMSGMTYATIVVEASETSGARMQARLALKHGRAVFLLQSLVDSKEWARDLVQEGRYGSHAIPVSTPEEVLERLQPARSPDAVEHLALG